jgi:hypothetical protein
MNTYDVKVIRTGYATRTDRVEANTLEEAKQKALDRAGDFEYSDNTSEYEIGAVTKIKE